MPPSINTEGRRSRRTRRRRRRRRGLNRRRGLVAVVSTVRDVT